MNDSYGSYQGALDMEHYARKIDYAAREREQEAAAFMSGIGIEAPQRYFASGEELSVPQAQALMWLIDYKGSFAFLLDVRAQLLNDRPLSEKQVDAIVRSKAREDAQARPAAQPAAEPVLEAGFFEPSLLRQAVGKLIHPQAGRTSASPTHERDTGHDPEATPEANQSREATQRNASAADRSSRHREHADAWTVRVTRAS